MGQSGVWELGGGVVEFDKIYPEQRILVIERNERSVAAEPQLFQKAEHR